MPGTCFSKCKWYGACHVAINAMDSSCSYTLFHCFDLERDLFPFESCIRGQSVPITLSHVLAVY